MMEYDSSFEETLIAQVQQYTNLWDPSNKMYKDATTTLATWEEIGNRLGKDGIYCCKKWTSLRSMFSTNSKKYKIYELEHPEDTDEIKKWKHYASMTFLTDFITPRKPLPTFDQMTSSGSTAAPSSQPSRLAKTKAFSAVGVGVGRSASGVSSMMTPSMSPAVTIARYQPYEMSSSHQNASVNNIPGARGMHTPPVPRPPPPQQVQHNPTAGAVSAADEMFGKMIASELAVFPPDIKSKIKTQMMLILQNANEAMSNNSTVDQFDQGGHEMHQEVSEHDLTVSESNSHHFITNRQLKGEIDVDWTNEEGAQNAINSLY